MEVSAGIKVRARGLLWEVIDVDHLGSQQRLHLRCATGDLRGLSWSVLWPNEPIEIARSELRPDTPGDLTAWRLLHTACLLDQVPGPGHLLAADPGRLQEEPYQLVPLMRALETPRPRLLLADGVGLGKTIQAGLIATELIARRRAHRILIIAPAGPLLVQWDQEMRFRFGLRFTRIADSSALRDQRRGLELGGNPFDSVALCLTSLDFAKQERVLEELERSTWDLAIIDEAHHCVSTENENTLRRRLAEVVAKRSDGLLLLTATPHDGYDPHFASLIALLDPSLVDGHGGLIGQAYRRHVVRRLKSHIHDPATGRPLFRERIIVPVPVQVTGPGAAAVRDFHKALTSFVAPRLLRAARAGTGADALAFVGLLKRSVSTVDACLSTLQVVLERYQRPDNDTAALRRERARALRAYERRARRFGVLEASDEADVADLEAEDIAADLRSSGGSAVASALEALIRQGRQAAPHDPKLDALTMEIRLIRARHKRANILVYTEYADSQAAVLHTLRPASGITGDVLAISGSDGEAARTAAAERCATEDNIILVSTDSLAEGLNLHQHCWHLIHLDLPYNPNRLEQRNGRIDRYGQRHDPEIRYLYLAGTFEERLLLRLIDKYEKARGRLTFMPDTLGVTADAAAIGAGLIAGFAEELFAPEPRPIRTLDQAGEETNAEAYRDLARDIERAFESFEYKAVHYGWAAGHIARNDAAAAAAEHAIPRDGGIDLLDFVTSAIAADGGTAGCAGRLVLPVSWTRGLDGLPGYTLTLREPEKPPCQTVGVGFYRPDDPTRLP